MRAGANGFVRRLLVEPGRAVRVGEALVESEEPTLRAELESLRARVAELDARLATERFSDRVQAEITTTELEHARAELGLQADRAERLIVRSRAEGTFAMLKPHDLPGRFVREGQEIGYVLPAGSCLVRATVRQDDIDLVRAPAAQRLGQAGGTLDETPAGAHRSRGAGGPRRAAEPGAGHARRRRAADRSARSAGQEDLQRVFQVDLELPAEAAARPPSAGAPTCASITTGSPWASRSGGERGSSCCRGSRPDEG